MIFSLWKLTKDLFRLTIDRDSENLLPFPMKITVFFVFYWHLFKILRKNGKVAESGPRTGRIRAIPAVSVRRYTGSGVTTDGTRARRSGTWVLYGACVSQLHLLLRGGHQVMYRPVLAQARELYKVKERETLEYSFCKHVSKYSVHLLQKKFFNYNIDIILEA